MKDLTSPFWIKMKGGLFLLMGIAAVAFLILDNPKWQTAAMLAVAIWSFCRCYYFAFYVIENYVDPGYRFAGLFSFAHYMICSGKKSSCRQMARKGSDSINREDMNGASRREPQPPGK